MTKAWLRRAAVLLAVCALAAGCVSRSVSDAGTAGDGGDDSPLFEGGALPGPPGSCAHIRTCVHRCKSDAACARACVDAAPAAVQSLFQAADTCSKKECGAKDLDCRCATECFVPGVCTAEVDRCVDNQADPFCDEICH